MMEKNSKTQVQIKTSPVSIETSRTLKAEAARLGLSLRDYVAMMCNERADLIKHKSAVNV